MTFVLLFVFGTLFGSFLNVIALRYDPDEFLFRRASIGGRSHCPGCGATLRWFELIPFISFALQRGRCRACERHLSFQYPLTEALCGLMFVVVGRTVLPAAFGLNAETLALIVWLAIFCALFLMTLIDIRLYLIPDELNIFLALAGGALALINVPAFGTLQGSLIGPLGGQLGLGQSIFVNRLAAALVAAIFFGALIIGTRGRGMGEGDLKLGAALGLVFGWPDTLFVLMLAFVFGAVVGIWSMMAGKKTMKSALPFGPFLALSALTIFGAGEQLLRFVTALVSPV